MKKYKSVLISRFKARFAAQVTDAIAGAALILILTRLLTSEEYGLLYLAISIFGTAKFFSEFGIPKSGARFISRSKEEKDGQSSYIIRSTLFLTFITTGIMSMFFMLFHNSIAGLIGEPDLSSLLLIGVLYIIFETLREFSKKILQAFEDINSTAVIDIVTPIARVIFAGGFVFFGFEVVGAFFGYIIASVIASTIGFIYIYKKHYSHEDGQKDPGLERRVGKYALPIASAGASSILDKRMDIILIGFFVGPIAVAYYTLSKQIKSFVEAPIVALSFTLAPTYEAEQAKGNSGRSAKIYENALLYGLLFYIPAAAGLILISEPLVRFVFGDNYLGAVPVLQIMCIYLVFQSVNSLASSGLDYLGRAKYRAIAKVITSILNLVLNLILIPLYGAVGAAIALVISYSIYTIVNIYIMGVELHIRSFWLLKQFIVIILITCLMGIVVHFASVHITGIVTLFLVVLLGTVVWASLVSSSGIVDITDLAKIIKN